METTPDNPASPANSGASETPSGKGAKDENFPVGSFLLPKRLRPHVATYYAFARAIDDIADNPDLPSEEKVARLSAFDAALRGEANHDPRFAKAHALRESLAATGVTTKHGSDLVAAFVQDARKNRYATWDELLGYCALSANPVGRYLLDLHGEDKSGYVYSDALCTVLQIVNHLQDCGDDRRELDRVYIIGDWLEEEGGLIEDLDRDALTPGMRKVADRMLDGCEALMPQARALSKALNSKSLAMESAVIVNLADRLITLLRKGDPLATRVALTKLDFASASLRGAVGGFFAAGRGRFWMNVAAPAISPDEARRHAQATVKKSGTSFGAGMRILSRARREAMYAIYAFCREVDDIADEEGTLLEKRSGLHAWRMEIERLYRDAPTTPTGVALLDHVKAYDLPKEEFILVIEGMEMDAAGPIVAPTMEGLLAYTRRAAGAVGMLSMPVFGAPKSKAAEDFALALGDALQLTNILRDVEEDAAEGRLYLPAELLQKHNCLLSPEAVINAPGLPKAREEVAGLAREKFSAAREALGDLDWKMLRPALLMMGVYERYLDIMTARGWENGQSKPELSKFEKMMIAARWFVAPKLKAA